MQPPEAKNMPITIQAPNTLLSIPHMLKQQNFDSTGQTVVNPGHVTLRVLPHTDVPASPVPVSCGELFPTQNQMRTNVYSEQESDWSKHAIVASVAGLEKKLAQLDSEMRTAPSTEVPIHVMMGQVQDHAGILRKQAQLASEANSRHKETTSLTHQICSQMNDTVESHATSLQKFEADIQHLKTKQKNAVDLTHGICSTLDEKQKNAVALTHQILSALDKDVQDHALQTTDLKHNVSRLQQSNVIAHKLLTQILGMLGQHHDVVSKLQDGLPADQITLLDAMCEAFEKTKGKMTTFEKTQQEMQRIITEFQSGKLTSSATHDSHEMQQRLEKYIKLSHDMDAKLSETVARQQSKIRELDDAHQSSVQQQQSKISELERTHQTSMQKHQSKIHELEAKVQELSLQQLNISQNASIARTTDRDVKQLQHELKHVHALKKDVEAILQVHDDSRLRDRANTEICRDIQHIKSQVSAVSDAQQRNSAKSEIAEVNSKMQELRRDMMLQDVRLDKTHMHIVDIRKKMEM
jgi:ArsR family metal-binding transcriptional regulator